MSIGNHLLDVAIGPITGTWDERDSRIYALGVGAGMEDPGRELEFTTENTAGSPLRVLPTFGLLEGCRAGIAAALTQMGDVDVSRMLHGEQKIEVHKEFPVSGSVETSGRFTAVWDKGDSGAVVQTRSFVRDATSGELYATCEQSLFFRGYGGWGGNRGPQRVDEKTVKGEPDERFKIRTRPDQPLLYRLSGDDNPLHSDPVFARQAGFPGPIMHGLCVLGSVSRVLLQRYGNSDPARFKSVAARFSAPTMPGDDLNVAIWRSGDRYLYEVENQSGTRLLSGGVLELLP